MPENGTIVVKSENEKDLVKISVFNEGPHIEETDLEKIWDQFYRTDKSRAKKTGGTGLGLMICREILEKHGSFYGAENVEGGVLFLCHIGVTRQLYTFFIKEAINSAWMIQAPNARRSGFANVKYGGIIL